MHPMILSFFYAMAYTFQYVLFIDTKATRSCLFLYLYTMVVYCQDGVGFPNQVPMVYYDKLACRCLSSFVSNG